MVFHSNSGGIPATYAVSAQGGAPRRLPVGEVGDWSHDGKQVYFNSHGQIWRTGWPLSPTAPEPVQVTRGGGIRPRLSTDNRFVYYLKDGEEVTSLWKVPASGGRETEMIDSVCCEDFEPIEHGIYFIPGPHRGQLHSTIKFFDFATLRTITVADLTGFVAYGFSISPDHKALLFSQYPYPEADVWLVEHFR